MRIIKPQDSCPVLRARHWVKAGRIWAALRPLLGNGLITAEGEDHLRQRSQIGNALRQIRQQDIEAAVGSFELPPEGARVDLAELMLRFVEHAMRRVLFGVSCGGEEVWPAIRGWLRWFPLRVLGVPVAGWHLRRIDHALATLPRPAWMPATLTAREVRDQLATLYVASIETTAADLTWRMAGRPQLPIWFVPRQHRETGETVLILLSEDTKFGAGPRRCIGEQLAHDVAGAILQRMTVESRWLPLLLDLRPRWGLTRWPRRVLVERVPLS